MCCAGKEQGLDTTGLTETFNFGLPLGSLDTGSALDPFDWSAAPALESPYPKQDPHDDWPVPDELMACQQDAPEPPGVTPSRSGYTQLCPPLHDQHACCCKVEPC